MNSALRRTYRLLGRRVYPECPSLNRSTAGSQSECFNANKLSFLRPPVQTIGNRSRVLHLREMLDSDVNDGLPFVSGLCVEQWAAKRSRLARATQRGFVLLAAASTSASSFHNVSCGKYLPLTTTALMRRVLVMFSSGFASSRTRSANL